MIAPKNGAPGRWGLDQRGIALPLALLGLIGVSVVVATAVVTSSAELALSGAHQDGVSSLYEADASVDGFVAAQWDEATPSQRLVPMSDGEVALAGGSFKLTVTKLAQIDDLPTRAELLSGDPHTATSDETWSIIGRSADDRGRSVGKLLQTRRTLAVENVGFNITAGATFASDATITGSSLVSGKQNRDLCDGLGADSVDAVRHADGTTLNYANKNVYGDVEKDARNSEELVHDVFKGNSLDSIASYADLQFGTMFDTPGFNSSIAISSLRYKDDPTLAEKDSLYNWGCPGLIDTKQNCKINGGDMAYYPMVAIDAGGGTVSLTGDHAQGTLIILNGNATINGNFSFNGVIVVEGSLEIRGTGGDSKIQGAVIAKGDVSLMKNGQQDSEISGNATIQYNACEIANAAMGSVKAKLARQPQEASNGTFAWFEIFN